MAFLHGIEHLNLPADFTPVNDVVTAVIGLVGTAEGGEVNQLTLCKNAKDDAQFGTSGTIPEALRAIRMQDGTRGSALVFVVKVKSDTEDVTPADLVGTIDATGIRTGLQLFETALPKFGFEPMIYIVPRYSALGAVKQALVAVTNKNEAMAYIDTPDGYTFDDALTSRGPGGDFATLNDGQKLLFPHFLIPNPEYTGTEESEPVLIDANFQTGLPNQVTTNGTLNVNKNSNGILSAGAIEAGTGKFVQMDLTSCLELRIGAVSSAGSARSITVSYKKSGMEDYSSIAQPLSITGEPAIYNLTDLYPVLQTGKEISIKLENAATGGTFYLHEMYATAFFEPKYLNVPMSAFAAGLRAKIDLEEGWHVSSSNHRVTGVDGMDTDLTFALGDTNCEANLLNAAGVTTAVNMYGGGIVEWGNYSAGYPGNTNTEAFECVRRTRAIMKRAIQQACIQFIDKPFIKANVDAIRNTVNQYLNGLVSQGKIVYGQCFYRPESNPLNELAQGHLTFDIEFTPALPMQRLTFTYKIDLSQLSNIGV